VSDVLFCPCDSHKRPASDLIEVMIAEIAALYGDLDGVGPTPPTDFAPPDGIFLVGWDDGKAVAGGGVRQLDRFIGEIRRMYVVPDRRGKGIGRRLLDALEDEARRIGYQQIRLSTGPLQLNAVRLYETHGFQPIADYNNYPHTSFWGEKALSS
jgi:GNAT superfamily N-acetyltransferase